MTGIQFVPTTLSAEESGVSTASTTKLIVQSEYVNNVNEIIRLFQDQAARDNL